MKNALVFTFLLLFLGGPAISAPIHGVIAKGIENASGIDKADKEIHELVQYVEKIAQTKGENSKLTARQVGNLKTHLRRAEEAYSPILFYFTNIRDRLTFSNSNLSAIDHFRAIVALADDLDYVNVNYTISMADEGASIAAVQGRLKSIRFSLIDTTGNLLLAIGSMTEGRSLSVSDKNSVQSIYGALRSTFVRSYSALMEEPEGATGPRTVSYVSGSTMAHFSNLGPSDLSADEALRAEKSIAARLATNISNMETQNKTIGRYTKINNIENICAANLK